jgi:hypothetical protein
MASAPVFGCQSREDDIALTFVERCSAPGEICRDKKDAIAIRNAAQACHAAILARPVHSV